MGVRSCNNCCAIGRRLAEAVNACRTRRTRGEIGRRFLVVATDILLGADFGDAFFVADAGAVAAFFLVWDRTGAGVEGSD